MKILTSRTLKENMGGMLFALGIEGFELPISLKKRCQSSESRCHLTVDAWNTSDRVCENNKIKQLAIMNVKKE
jgi:hypothetical protein